MRSASARARQARSSQQQAIAALQDALAAEHAAGYGYGVVGAHLPQGSAKQGAATADWIAHLRVTDELIGMISARGGQPAPAAVAYQLPEQVQTAAASVALAVLLEDRVAQAYLAVVALPDSGLRSFGAQQVRAAALRAAAWRGSTQAFPGLPTTRAHG